MLYNQFAKHWSFSLLVFVLYKHLLFSLVTAFHGLYSPVCIFLHSGNLFSTLLKWCSSILAFKIGILLLLVSISLFVKDNPWLLLLMGALLLVSEGVLQDMWKE